MTAAYYTSAASTVVGALLIAGAIAWLWREGRRQGERPPRPRHITITQDRPEPAPRPRNIIIVRTPTWRWNADDDLS